MCVHGCSIDFVVTTQCGGKASTPVVVMECGKVILFNDEQPSKDPTPMAVIESGTMTLVRDEQL